VSGLWPLDIIDPQAFGYSGIHWELYRCCLLRTLMSYPGHPVERGESMIQPDLAIAYPEVSDDGLQWTFRLRSGLHYAPPFEDTEIVAADLVRALERLGDPQITAEDLSYAPYFGMIEGFERYHAGAADTIAGLETPDPHTLIVRLTEPTGDLGHRFSLTATAPIPARAAEGHRSDYFRFLVASGPYMVDGSGSLDPSLPPDQQPPVSGFVPDEALTLVRNPSWTEASDPLRPAFVDRIEIELLPLDLQSDRSTWSEIADRVDQGSVDFANWTVPEGQVRRYREDPALRERVLDVPLNSLFYVPLNLAVPPFDDVHVRRAVNLVINRAEMVDWMTRHYELDRVAYEVWHVFPDTLEGTLLAGWKPGWASSADDGASVDAAHLEMSMSRYDRDGDGLCDDPACRSARAVVQSEDTTGSLGAWWRQVRGDLATIGIHLEAERLPCLDALEAMGPPAGHVAFSLTTCAGWAPDFPNASTFAPLLDGRSISDEGGLNISLLGASPDQLRGWGYEVEDVPSIDDRIDRCMSLLDTEQVACWAELDQYLMEEIVPWVPLYTLSRTFIASDRIAVWPIDPVAGRPAFDQIALVPGSE